MRFPTAGFSSVRGLWQVGHGRLQCQTVVRQRIIAGKIAVGPRRLKAAGNQWQSRANGHPQHGGGLFPNERNGLVNLVLKFRIQINACFHAPQFAPIRCCAQDWILPGAWTQRGARGFWRTAVRGKRTTKEQRHSAAKPQPKWRNAVRWSKSLGDEPTNFSHRPRRPAGFS